MSIVYGEYFTWFNNMEVFPVPGSAAGRASALGSADPGSSLGFDHTLAFKRGICYFPSCPSALGEIPMTG